METSWVMKVFRLLALISMFSGVAPAGAAVVLWNESLHGDSPASLGGLSAGANQILGYVGHGGSSGDFIDGDQVRFSIPAGTVMAEFLVQMLSGDSYMNFSVHRDTNVGDNTVEFRLADAGDGVIDLLKFDSASGPQPAMDYFYVVGGGGTSDLKGYRITIVVAAIPEPSTASAFLLGSSVMIACRRRRR
jgi:hypothetical protein